MTHELVDIETARQHVRLQLAAIDGSPLREATECLARHIADHLATRPGRDIEAAGDALLEAAACLGGILMTHPLTPPEALVNITGVAGVELAQRAHDDPLAANSHDGLLRLLRGMLTETETDARRYRLAWLSAKRRTRRTVQ